MLHTFAEMMAHTPAGQSGEELQLTVTTICVLSALEQHILSTGCGILVLVRLAVGRKNDEDSQGAYRVSLGAYCMVGGCSVV